MKASDAALSQSTLLGLWLGGALFFVAVVAPAAFASLPTRTLAGAVVGGVLPALFYMGVVVGVATSLLEWSAQRRPAVTVRSVAGFVVAASCAVAQYVIAPRIEGVRAKIGGAIDSLPPDDARRVAFGQLHSLSVLWLGVAAVAATTAFVLAVRAQRVKT